MKKLLLILMILASTNPAGAAPSPETQKTAGQKIAGTIFGVAVPMGNYVFARAAAYIFGPPWGCSGQSAEDCEKLVWENLVLHYESFQRDLKVPPEKYDEAIDALLKDQGKTFTKKGDPEAYKRWVKEALNEDVEIFENQIQYLCAIRELKETVAKGFTITPTEEEARERYTDEHNAVGGEMAVFSTKTEAEAFQKTVATAAAWDAAKKKNAPEIKPVMTMSLQAYIDLWQVPKAQIYSVFNQAAGTVVVLPFGPKQWGALKIGEKKSADAAGFPAKKDHYLQQVERLQRAKKLREWIDQLKQKAAIKPTV